MTLRQKIKNWIDDLKHKIAPIMPPDYGNEEDRSIYREDMGMGEKEEQ
jgi:hypothetical protein